MSWLWWREIWVHLQHSGLACSCELFDYITCQFLQFIVLWPNILTPVSFEQEYIGLIHSATTYFCFFLMSIIFCSLLRRLATWTYMTCLGWSMRLVMQTDYFADFRFCIEEFENSQCPMLSTLGVLFLPLGLVDSVLIWSFNGEFEGWDIFVLESLI